MCFSVDPRESLDLIQIIKGLKTHPIRNSRYFLIIRLL